MGNQGRRAANSYPAFTREVDVTFEKSEYDFLTKFIEDIERKKLSLEAVVFETPHAERLIRLGWVLSATSITEILINGKAGLPAGGSGNRIIPFRQTEVLDALLGFLEDGDVDVSCVCTMQVKPSVVKNFSEFYYGETAAERAYFWALTEWLYAMEADAWLYKGKGNKVNLQGDWNAFEEFVLAATTLITGAGYWISPPVEVTPPQKRPFKGFSKKQ